MRKIILLFLISPVVTLAANLPMKVSKKTSDQRVTCEDISGKYSKSDTVNMIWRLEISQVDCSRLSTLEHWQIIFPSTELFQEQFDFEINGEPVQQENLKKSVVLVDGKLAIKTEKFNSETLELEKTFLEWLTLTDQNTLHSRFEEFSPAGELLSLNQSDFKRVLE